MASTPVSQGKPITPKQLVAQWRNLPHKFSVNVWNFEVKAGKAAQSVFQGSFDLGRFNSSGSTPWYRPGRTNKGGYAVGSLTESFSLKRSIKWKHMGSNGNASGVTIYTDPSGFNGTFSHKGFCYAAVHNAPATAHTRRGRVRNMPQRQFMGHSTVLEDELKQLSAMIFQGFPK